MAKSKRKRRKSQPQAAFFEAIPAMPAQPLGLPQVADELDSAIHQLGDKIRPWRNSFVVGTIVFGILAARKTGQLIQNTVIGARLAAESARSYGPAIAVDMARAARRLGRRLISRRARAMYLTMAAGAAFAGVLAYGVTSTATLQAYANDISSPAAILNKKKTGTIILDRHGEVLFQGYGAQATKVVGLHDIPESLSQATLAAEDPDFYAHPGFSWRGTVRAAVTDITHQSRREGGSTLTQQLVKNALLTSDKNFTRKFKEIVLATQIERQYSKDQILEMYLNETYYGQGSSGVEAASQTYFHKPAKDLTLGESALIAGLPLGPSRFDPNVDIESATGRRNYVLARMVELGKISQAQADAAKAQPIALAGQPEATSKAMVVYDKTILLRAPHFVFYVLDQLRQKYGEDMVENGGITVQTTLDLSKQAAAEAAVSTRISQLSGHHVTNGGLVSLEPKTGDIIAMVGSVDYNAPGFGNVNVALSELQPGSSFKPIAYATAFKKGWNGSTKVDDVPMVAPNGDGTLYIPQNYDLKFRGPVTLRSALANSLNIPAIKVLQYSTIHDTVKTAHDLGITTLNDESRFGLSLVLGGGEVRMIDMATVYATLDNGGQKVTPRAITKISDRYDKAIASPEPSTPEPVLDGRIAYMLTSILSDNAARTPEFGANSPLKLSRPAAAKTGTTNDFRDNWTVGYTPQLVTAVWVGNNDHSPMNNVDGITGAAPIWHDYMEAALAGEPVLDFTAPSGVTAAKVCADGGLANPWDSGYTEIFLSEALPTRHCATFPKPQPTPDDQPGNDKKDKKDGNNPTDTPSPTPIVLPTMPNIPIRPFNPFN